MRYADKQLEMLALAPSPFGDDPDVEGTRAALVERAAKKQPGPEMSAVEDLEVEGLPARLYRPRPEPSPLILYLHAGGWTVGGLVSSERLCRRLAAFADAAVIALDYRLAPEHPWPASVDDTIAAMRWIASAPELVYANTDLTGSQPSMRENATGGGIAPAAIRWFNSQWVPDQARWREEGVSPIAASDLSGMPPSLIVSAERDPLRDELEAYAERLRNAGLKVTSRREPGMIHNFLQFDEVSPAAAAAGERVARELGEMLRAAGARCIC